MRHRALPVILAVALVLRLALCARTIFFPADEIWQYIEPAWGRITGQWIETWEFHVGIRGWFIPMLLTPPLWLGHALAPASPLHLYLLRAMLSLASLGVVVSFYDMGASVSQRHAVVAGWVAAIWVEIVYFAPRAASEAIAVSLIVPAIALLSRMDAAGPGETGQTRRWHAVQGGIAGLLLALGLIARFQYAPAIAFAALWGPNRNARATLPPLMLGGLVGLGLGGLADLAAGQIPYAWVWANFSVNLVQGVSTVFGTEPPWWFLTAILSTWGWTSLLLLPCMVAGARRFPMPMAVALVVIANHSALPHKEYRFVLVAVVLLIFLAAIGSVDLADWLIARMRPWARRLSRAGHVIALVAVWGAMSLMVGFGAPFNGFWNSGHSLLGSLILAGQRPELCGLAIYRPPGVPSVAYSALNRPVPILLFAGSKASATLAANQRRFNSILTADQNGRELPGSFKFHQCFTSVDGQKGLRHFCIFTRPGPCSGGGGDFDYNTVLIHPSA